MNTFTLADTQFQGETPLWAVDVPKHCPRNGKGNLTHINSVVRWMKNGVRGVRLEYMRIGGRLVTTEEALARFFAALTDADKENAPGTAPAAPIQPALRSPVARRRAVVKAEAELARAGF